MHGCKEENTRTFGQLQVDADNATACRGSVHSAEWSMVACENGRSLTWLIELTKSNQGHVYGSMHA
jgi:hypothetical protein